ncbi:MAG: response regulator [Planctomycetes bacterium]|nr:response regulator [Planctomycetota bacterium]
MQTESDTNITRENSTRLLLVEDDLTSQKLIRLSLQKMDVDLTIVDSGYDCIEIVQKQSFDIILMDIRMPIMDGYKTTKILRRAGLTIPIIAVTACALKDDREKCISSGCNDYISKPIRIERLREIINKHLITLPN